MRVGVIGTGYVGLVTGVCLAYLGHDVTGIDQNTRKIEQLSAGHPPIFEPGLASLLATGLASQKLRFSVDLEAGIRGADVIFIAVGTPPLPTGEPDLSEVAAAARAVGATLEPDSATILIIQSTVSIGACQWIASLVSEEIMARVAAAHPARHGEPAYKMVANPVFVREGTAIHDTLYPDRIVIGAEDSAAIETMRQLFEPIATQRFAAPEVAPRPTDPSPVPFLTTDLQSAEMIKATANAFLATKISFANEIAVLCEKVGADIVEVMRGIGLDARIGSGALEAGIGWGGNRFDKSIGALMSIAQEYGSETHLLSAAVAINRAQRRRLIQKLQDHLKVIKGRTIGLLGIALKPGTDDLRDVPALEVAKNLLGMGAKIKLYDPVAIPACRDQFPDLAVTYVEDPEALATGADALMVMTEWDAFRTLDLPSLGALMRTPLLVDGRNIYRPDAVAAAGFTYVGIGR